MKPGDILEYRCPNFGIVWQWHVLSICHGADRQEGLIEVRPVMAGDGFAHNKRMESVWVPEPMTRGLSVFATPGAGDDQGSE